MKSVRVFDDIYRIYALEEDGGWIQVYESELAEARERCMAEYARLIAKHPDIDLRVYRTTEQCFAAHSMYYPLQGES